MRPHPPPYGAALYPIGRDGGMDYDDVFQEKVGYGKPLPISSCHTEIGRVVKTHVKFQWFYA